MPVPNTFGTATSAIPLSQLDANFDTPITLGNTAIQLGNTVTTLNNMTLANVTISSGTITITNVAVTTANVSGTANISTLVVVGNATVGGNTTITGNITAANANVTSNLVLSGGTANGVAYLNTSKQVTTGSALVFDGSGNLGIGTALPASRLSVVAGTMQSQLLLGVNTTNANYGSISLNGINADSTRLGFTGGGTGDNTLYIDVPTSGQYAFRMGSTQAMTLGSTGNLLLGNSTDPLGSNRLLVQSANTANNNRVMSVYNSAATSTTAFANRVLNLATLGSGADVSISFTDSVANNAYIGMGSGALYFAIGGGTTKNMTLDASGNFGVGTSTSTNRQTLQFSNTATTANSESGLSIYNSARGNNYQATVKFGSYESNNSTRWTAAEIGAAFTAYSDGANSGALLFSTSNAGTVAERARITSGGYFKASNTGTYVGSSGAYHEFVTDDIVNALVVRNSSTSQTSDGTIFLSNARNTTDGTYSIIGAYNTTAGAFKFKVLDSGNVQNTNNSYGQISDIKLKENILDATPKLEKLNQVRVVNFNFIGDQQKQLGVIAQELEQIFPSMVDETPDYEEVLTTDEDGNKTTKRVATGTTTKSVKYSVFVPMLIKALQEQQALITTLTARITALEGA